MHSRNRPLFGQLNETTNVHQRGNRLQSPPIGFQQESSTDPTTLSRPSSIGLRPSEYQGDFNKQRMAYGHRGAGSQRSALFPDSRKSQHMTSNTIGKPADRHGTQMSSDLEAQNDELLNEMHNKVLGLKEVSWHIRTAYRWVACKFTQATTLLCFATTLFCAFL